MTIARRYLYETADAVRLEALAAGTWAPLAELVGKIRREERYHLMHVEAWLDRLARAEGEPRRRLVAALETLGPDAGTVFTPLPDDAALVEAGILAGSLDRARAAVARGDRADDGAPGPAATAADPRSRARPPRSRRRLRVAAR